MGRRETPFPTAPLRVHPAEHAGRSVAEKIRSVRAAMRDVGVDRLVVSPLDEVAWLFNVRGGDLAYNPVSLAYGIVGKDTATMYVDAAKVTAEVAAHLAEGGVEVKPYDACAEDVRAAAAEGERLWVDADKVSVALVTAAEESVAAERAPKVAKKGAEEDVAAAGSRLP